MPSAERLWKAASSLNLATLLRAARFGPRDAAAKAVSAYELVDPLGKVPHRYPDPRVWSFLAAVPKVQLSEVIAGMPAVILDGEHKYKDGSLHLPDQFSLMAVIRDRRPRLVLEIGTFNGSTTRLIALNLPESAVHTLDLPEDVNYASIQHSSTPKDDFHLIAKRRVGDAFRSDPSITNITQHFGDSATWDYSPVRGVDFVFIDGSHTYEHIMIDTIRSAEAAAERATIVWHDFNPNKLNVVRYISELANAGLPVRHIDLTNMAILDYNRTPHLAKIRAIGDGSPGSLPPNARPVGSENGIASR